VPLVAVVQTSQRTEEAVEWNFGRGERRLVVVLIRSDPNRYFGWFALVLLLMSLL
jgi:hypothetical protein